MEELKDLNLQLEEKVEERTAALRAAMDELETLNMQLVDTRDMLWGEMQLAKKIQTVFQALIRDNPKIKPSKLIEIVNRALTYNIKNLGDLKYMTLTALAVFPTGRVLAAGLHQKILVYRAKSKIIDSIESEGCLIGVYDDISQWNKNFEFTIDQGDIVLLYTDGITEAWKKKAYGTNVTLIKTCIGIKCLWMSSLNSAARHRIVSLPVLSVLLKIMIPMMMLL